MISYLFRGNYYKEKCQMHALQYSYQPGSLLRELFFQSVFLQKYSFSLFALLLF